MNLDSDDGSIAPQMLKAVARAHENTDGVYATVTRIGRLAAGHAVVLHRQGPAEPVPGQWGGNEEGARPLARVPP